MFHGTLIVLLEYLEKSLGLGIFIRHNYKSSQTITPNARFPSIFSSEAR